MKYLIACLVIPPVQIVFMLAFTLFALSVGVIALSKKVRQVKLPD